jgi:DNA-binding protein HU-beta
VTKQEVVERVAEQCDLSKAAAGRALEAMLDTLTEVMADGEEVSFTGFGKFLSQRRRARDAVNPQDPSQKIRIRAANVPKFRPGSALREAVSQAPAAEAGRSAAFGDGAGTPSSSGAPAGSTKMPEWRPLGERG